MQCFIASAWLRTPHPRTSILQVSPELLLHTSAYRVRYSKYPALAKIPKPIKLVWHCSVFTFQSQLDMQFAQRAPVDTEVEGSETSSIFVRFLSLLPLCPKCKALVDELSDATGHSMTARRSDFDHVTQQPGSCSLCFCLRHLLPIDLPWSTEITVILLLGSTPDSIVSFKVLECEKRILGSMEISDRDVIRARDQEPLPTMNFQAISRLLHECEEQHQHQNWNLPRYRSPTRLQLIDVQDMMVISATSQRRYLALSYVWGEHDSFAATSKNRETLSQKGGLSQHMNEIPQTIKDAMDVVRNLGERYLWVDRLCIEQDNSTQKDVHIEKMDIIYSHALITIIAHAGIATTSPLPGLQPGTRLRLPTKRVGNFVLAVAAPNLWESGAPHETRGWTLQEQLMSKRCLFFDFHTTWFQCDKGMCKEIDAEGDGNYDLLQPPASFNMHSLRSILVDAGNDRRFEDIWNIYATIIERYRTRKLRYVEDTVKAIQGVAQVISDLLDVPLISAVPSSMLPCALQFYLRPQEPESGRNEGAPSWSWAGWKESIYFNDSHFATQVPFEAPQLEMKIKYKAHTPIKDPIQGVHQPQGFEVVEPTEEAGPHAPYQIYTLLDIECSFTKSSAFRVDIQAQASIRSRDVPIISGMISRVFDQRGTSCGHSFGHHPQVSKEDYQSDEFQWILLSRSQPIQVSG